MTEKDKAVVGKAMRVFSDDPRNIPMQSTKWLKTTLRAMGIIPTTDDKEQLVFQVCRGLGSSRFGGGAVILDEAKSPPPKRVTAIQNAVPPMDLIVPTTQLSFPRNAHPKTIRLSMSFNTLFIQNLSRTTLDLGGCKAVAVFKRRLATISQPEDDGYTGGKWSENEPNPGFEFPAHLHVPPDGVVMVLCGRGKEHLGECTDVPSKVQKICWSPLLNPLKDCWGVALLDSTGRRNQLVTRKVLLQRRQSDRAALPSPASSPSPTPRALFDEFTSEISAAYAANPHVEEFEEIPGEPTYEHQVIGLHNLVRKNQEDRASRELTHPDDQGIIQEYSETRRREKLRHHAAVYPWG
eukprot:TRINITY_DN15004_c0_g1_i1.p1 TRINITY_DN15004_c0_g1~~TRINITY_DN15004_c0_g1_i1.p1  ORF type:complete len:369 (+),score=40.71 TRINITY_DN15004_c0_g1_i1:56-1108(+)